MRFKNILKNLCKLARQFYWRRRAKCALVRLAESQDLRLKAIGSAIQETLAQKLSDQEQAAIVSIEKRRDFLLKDSREIAVVDYGAGPREITRTEEEMENGVQSTSMVSSVTEASESRFWATILFKIIRKLEPLSCVEMGSCVGISASYQAAALKLNGKGFIVTIEGSPEVADVAKDTFEILGLNNVTVVTGPFHQTLLGVMEESRPIDYFFNDGHHDRDAVIRYFNDAMPCMADDAVVVFDDISWSAGMKKAWSEIEKDDRVAASINLHTIGIALIGRSPAAKLNLNIPL